MDFWIILGVYIQYFSLEVHFNASYLWICGSFCRTMCFSSLNEHAPQCSNPPQGWQMAAAELPKIVNYAQINLKMGSKKSRCALETSADKPQIVTSFTREVSKE